MAAIIKLVRASAGKPAPIEERLLLGVGAAPERGIAVGKASEAANDIEVQHRVFCKLLVAVALCERKTALLIGGILRMHERQEQEASLDLRYPPVEAARERPLRDRARERVGRIAALVAAEHVAR